MTTKITTISSVLTLVALGPQYNVYAQDSVGPVFEEIVVTAQKRTQSVVDVPIAMSVLNSSQLEKTRAKSLADIQQLIPNLTLEPANGFANISIRGVGGGGRNIGFDSRSGLYIDGVYIGQAAALQQPLFDIERVEVLRGPQGHLFGRNTVSGAVNLVTRAPSEETGGSLKAVIGNKDTYEIYGTIEGALDEKVLGKISAAYETRGGLTTNLFNDEKIDDLKRTTLRAQLRFLASEKLTVDVFGDYSNTKQTQIIGEPQTDLFSAITPGFPAPPRTVNFNITPRSNSELAGGSVAANYTLDDGHIITSVSGYRFSQLDTRNDTDYGPRDLVSVNFFDKSNQFSQEIRLVSPDDQALRYVVGLYYLREDAKTERHVPMGEDIQSVFATIPTDGDIIVMGDIVTSSYAAFSAIDFDIADWVTLNLGGRYTHENKNLDYDLEGNGIFGIATLLDSKHARSEDNFKPTIGFTFAASKNVNLYAKFATGFKSGGFNVDFLNALAVDDFSFDTETVKSYEVGVKGTAADGRFHFDLAGFVANYDDFQNLQFVDLGGGVTSIRLRNAAKVKTQGVEAALTAYITDNLKVSANIGILDATFSSFPDAAGLGVDYDGESLLNAPKFTGSIAVDYHMPVNDLNGAFDAYFEFSHRDTSRSRLDPDPTRYLIDSRNLVNTRVSYTPNEGSWTLSLWSNNLFNEDYLDRSSRDFLGNQIIRRGHERTFGAAVKVKF